MQSPIARQKSCTARKPSSAKVFPSCVLAARDAAEYSIVEAADRLAEQGAAVFVTSSKPSKATALPFVATSHPLTDPLALLVSLLCVRRRLCAQPGIESG